MSNATNFYQNNLLADIKLLIQVLENLSTDQDRLITDTSLAAACATVANSLGQSGLVAADFTNVAGAINQLLFTWNSGTPTQKSFFYKII